jgi:hypothetical protein
MSHAKISLATAVFAAMISLPAAAQVGSDPQAIAALAAAYGQKQEASCADAKELEIPFALTLYNTSDRRTFERHFQYAGCHEEGRNDYQPPYTARYYKDEAGLDLVIVTDNLADNSEVLIFRARDMIKDFRSSNNDLVSGDLIDVRDKPANDVTADTALIFLEGLPKTISPDVLSRVEQKRQEWQKLTAPFSSEEERQWKEDHDPLK